MKTYVVTGGAGFIGSNYIHYMLGKYRDIRIINFDCLTYAGNLDNLRSIENDARYLFVKADICDRQAVLRIFSEQDIDYVVHFAAESHVDRSIASPEEFVRTNVMGTFVLLDVARSEWGDNPDGKLFVHVSTDEVYGSLGLVGYFTEKTPLDPHSPYSASKAGSDMLVKSYCDTFKMPIVITRCSNNYGPYQYTEKLIPLMISNALAGKRLPVYGDGKNVRDWLYVEDHARAIDIVSQKGRAGEVYNIGGHNEYENIAIVEIILDTLRDMLPLEDPRRGHVTRELIEYVKDRKGHDRRYAIDPSKITGELGWSPETKFDKGIRMTIEWYLKNGDWIERLNARR
jgi:dTDP-glucose 4,6-dehydratase